MLFMVKGVGLSKMLGSSRLVLAAAAFAVCVSALAVQRGPAAWQNRPAASA
jgi:hypothetical protein